MKKTKVQMGDWVHPCVNDKDRAVMRMTPMVVVHVHAPADGRMGFFLDLWNPNDDSREYSVRSWVRARVDSAPHLVYRMRREHGINVGSPVQ